MYLFILIYRNNQTDIDEALFQNIIHIRFLYFKGTH